MMRQFLLAILLLTGCGEYPAEAQTLLFSDDFDGGTATGWDEAFFTDTHYTPTTAESKYVTTPASPTGASHVIHYYALDDTNEVNVVKLTHDFVSGDESEVFAVWYEYFRDRLPISFNVPKDGSAPIFQRFLSGESEGNHRSSFTREPLC
jgi:hypothetical protein